MVGPSPNYIPHFIEFFGNPDADYQAALDRHYNKGAPAGGRSAVSSYATMHPAEDWAETFAHYLHIRDTFDTSAAFGFAPRVRYSSGERWAPAVSTRSSRCGCRSRGVNMVNRSMGKEDIYPFVLPPAVLEKMRFIHSVIDELA